MATSTKTCPNCGKAPARSDTDVLCNDCYQSCPFDPAELQTMEDSFKVIMAMFPKMQGEE